MGRVCNSLPRILSEGGKALERKQPRNLGDRLRVHASLVRLVDSGPLT